jgi:hypothetical protein
MKIGFDNYIKYSDVLLAFTRGELNVLSHHWDVPDGDTIVSNTICVHAFNSHAYVESEDTYINFWHQIGKCKNLLIIGEIPEISELDILCMKSKAETIYVAGTYGSFVMIGPQIRLLPYGFCNNVVPAQLNLEKRDILCYCNFTFTDTSNLLTSEISDKYHKNTTLYYKDFLRTQCMNYFKNQSSSWCTIKSGVDSEEFHKDLNRSKFVVCPCGTGLDTYRIYESSWVGARPVVLRSSYDPLYEKFGCIIVDRWSDITKEFLENYSDDFKIDYNIFEVDYYIK